MRGAQGASYVYEAFVSPALKKAGEEARKVPALKKALDQIDAFVVRTSRKLGAQGLSLCIALVLQAYSAQQQLPCASAQEGAGQE